MHSPFTRRVPFSDLLNTLIQFGGPIFAFPKWKSVRTRVKVIWMMSLLSDRKQHHSHQFYHCQTFIQQYLQRKVQYIGASVGGGWTNTFDDVIRPREKQTPPTRRPAHITCEGTAESHCWILKLTELGHVQKWLLQPRPRSVGLQRTVVKWKYMAGLWWPRSENSGQSNVIPTVPIHHGERRRMGVTVAYVSHWTLCSRKRMDQHHWTSIHFFQNPFP